MILKNKKKKKEIKLCPKCHKPTLTHATNVSGWLAPSKYKCMNCEYVGALYFVYDPEESSEQLENLENAEAEFKEDL